MTHIAIDLDSINWAPFLSAQEGGGTVDGTRYFTGTRYQRGFGIMGTVGRFLLPIVRNLATTAGNEAVNVGQKMLEGVSQGQSVQEALKTHGTQGLQNMAEKLRQCGKGKKKKQRKRKQPSAKQIITRIENLGRRQRRYRDQLSDEM
jgi:hypothetical protein